MNDTLKEQLTEIKTKDRVSELAQTYFDNLKIFSIENKEIEDMTNKYILNWAEDNKKSNKIFSKKAVIRLENQRFVLHLKDKKTYIFFKVKMGKNKKEFLVLWGALHHVSTLKGILYYFKMPQIGQISCFYSHFFDRMAQRVYDNATRIKAMENYVWELAKEGTYIFNKHTGSLEIIKDNGMILGKYGFIREDNQLISEKNWKDKDYCPVIFVVHETFISNNMLKSEQEILCKKARGQKLKLNENDFFVMNKVG